jgi:hypothetical protein
MHIVPSALGQNLGSSHKVTDLLAFRKERKSRSSTHLQDTGDRMLTARGNDPRPTIDVQVHAHERYHPSRPWVRHIAGPDHVTGDEMAAAAGAPLATAPGLVFDASNPCRGQLKRHNGAPVVS